MNSDDIILFKSGQEQFYFISFLYQVCCINIYWCYPYGGQEKNEGFGLSPAFIGVLEAPSQLRVMLAFCNTVQGLHHSQLWGVYFFSKSLFYECGIALMVRTVQCIIIYTHHNQPLSEMIDCASPNVTLAYIHLYLHVLSLWVLDIFSWVPTKSSRTQLNFFYSW